MIPENTETKKIRTAVDKKETGIKREKQKMEDGDYVEPVKKKSKVSSSNKKDGKNPFPLFSTESYFMNILNIWVEGMFGQGKENETRCKLKPAKSNA